MQNTFFNHLQSNLSQKGKHIFSVQLKNAQNIEILFSILFRAHNNNNIIIIILHIFTKMHRGKFFVGGGKVCSKIKRPKWNENLFLKKLKKKKTKQAQKKIYNEKINSNITRR